ncbi:MAG: hypothetical protein HQ592_08345 [Planctomycetes bacterium]|nr:hypothetical protein [Planctomycetota bacterium]
MNITQAGKLIALWCALWMCSPPSLAEDAIDHLEPPVLRDVMWQVLPDNIRSVYVGPDGRLWWQIDHRREEPEIGKIREIIERQFGNESPVIYGARIALFEPGGRTWFIDHSGKHLIAYDGKRWIERQVTGFNSFCGSCPNHGRYERKGYNLILRREAFFLDSYGVHCFDLDKQTWSYQPMSAYKCMRAYLVPEPDGRGLIACFNGVVNTRANPTECIVELWRLREGNWTPLDVPQEILNSRIAGITPVKNGVWIDEQDRRSEYHRPEDRKKVPPARLWFVAFDAEAGQDDNPPFALGPYKAKDAVLIEYDGSGTTYFAAKQIFREEELLGPGMLIRRVDGQVTALLGERFAGCTHQDYRCGGSGPLAVAGRNALWTPYKMLSSKAALMVSLETGDVMATMPDQNFIWLHSALDDGTVFVSISEPGQAYSTIIVYKPDAPDTRVLLEVRKIEAKRRVFCVASDGALWAAVLDPADPTRGSRQESMILRFNGKAWQPVEAFRGWTDTTRLIPGRNGEILAIGTYRSAFLMDGLLYPENSLETLIALHHKKFASAFFMGSSTGRQGKVVADKAGNIWLSPYLRPRRPLKVLIGDTWLDATASLCKAGSRDGRKIFIATIGDGSMVYVTDITAACRGGTSFYGEVVDGDLIFVPAPACDQGKSIRGRARDHNNTLWVPASIATYEGDGWMTIHGQEVHLITGDFAPKRLTDVGRPILCDKSGNMWLGQQFGKKRDVCDIYTNGKLAHSLVIPSSRHPRTWPISDRPGSVFARTVTGIYHFTADNPAEPAKYTLKKRYDLTDSVEGGGYWTGYSSLGYMVICLDGNNISPFYLIKLPEPEKK